MSFNTKSLKRNTSKKYILTGELEGEDLMDLMNLMDTSENLHNLAFKENKLLSHRN